MSSKHAEWGRMAHEGSVWEIPGLVDALRRQAKPEVYTAAELAKQLSERFGVLISRNAVMGKCWRENIPLRGRKGPEPRPKPPKPMKVIQEYLKAPRVKRSSLLKCDEPEPKGDTPEGCRWMHGPAEDRVFCGAPTVRWGVSWCHHHCARVWNPATPAQTAKFAKFVTWRAA
jgi:hypothetical protein